MANKEATDVECGRERTRHAQEVRNVFTSDAHAAHDHRGLERAAQIREVRAETAPVEVIDPERTPPRQRVGDLGMIVRPGRGKGVGEVAVRLEEIQHARSVVEKRLGKIVIEAVAHFVPEVGKRRLGRILDPCTPGMGTSGNPDDARRHRGGAAEHRLLFGNDDVETQMGGAHRGAQASSARADDQHVAATRRRVSVHPASHPPSTYKVVPVM